MFHVELRQFPHVARAFNWTREELDARILARLVTGRPVELDDRRWSPEKVKVTVYEGPELGVEEMGMGRGWGNAAKAGVDVTDRVVHEAREAAASPPALDALKAAIAERARAGPVGFEALLKFAGDLAADLDVNQRVQLVSRAVWELLREGRVRLAGPEPHPGPEPGQP